MSKYGKLQEIEEITTGEEGQVLKLVFKDDTVMQTRIWPELADGTSLRDQLWDNSDFVTMLKEEPDTALLLINILSRVTNGPQLRYEDVATEEFKAPSAKILESETLFESWFKLLRLKLQYQRFDGEWSEPHDHVAMFGSAGTSMLLYDPELDNVVMIEEFRAGRAFMDEPFILGLPGGGLEPEEDPQEGVIREAVEEAGIKPYAIRHLITYHPVAAFSDNLNHTYLGLVRSENAKGVYGLDNENENIRVRVLPFDDAVAMISEGKIINGSAMTALLYFALHKESILGDLGNTAT